MYEKNEIYIYIHMIIYIYQYPYVLRRYARNYIKKVFQGGDHSKNVFFNILWNSFLDFY